MVKRTELALIVAIYLKVFSTLLCYKKTHKLTDDIYKLFSYEIGVEIGCICDQLLGWPEVGCGADGNSRMSLWAG